MCIRYVTFAAMNVAAMNVTVLFASKLQRFALWCFRVSPVLLFTLYSSADAE